MKTKVNIALFGSLLFKIVPSMYPFTAPSRIGDKWFEAGSEKVESYLLNSFHFLTMDVG
jgi:hypothetical protein